MNAAVASFDVYTCWRSCTSPRGASYLQDLENQSCQLECWSLRTEACQGRTHDFLRRTHYKVDTKWACPPCPAKNTFLSDFKPEKERQFNSP